VFHRYLLMIAAARPDRVCLKIKTDFFDWNRLTGAPLSDIIKIYLECLDRGWTRHSQNVCCFPAFCFHSLKCSGIEVVITGLTRNQFASNRTRVRIPPAAPPGKGPEPFRALGLFLYLKQLPVSGMVLNWAGLPKKNRDFDTISIKIAVLSFRLKVRK
jgi:hypothetical protein